MPRTTLRGRPRPSPGDPLGSGLPDVLQFMRLLWAIVHALQKTSKRMNAEIGVTGPQRLVLRVVGRSARPPPRGAAPDGAGRTRERSEPADGRSRGAARDRAAARRALTRLAGQLEQPGR